MKRDLDNRPVPDNPRYDASMHKFFHNVPLGEFTAALALQEEQRFRDLQTSMTDPRNSRMTLVTLCRHHAVTLTDLQDVWRRHQVNLGLMAMSTFAPKVMENIASDAASFTDLCPTCRGKGKLSRKSKSLCPRCSGHGVIQKPGDLESRHIMMQALGVTGDAPPWSLTFSFSASFGPDQGMEKIIEMVQVRPGRPAEPEIPT